MDDLKRTLAEGHVIDEAMRRGVKEALRLHRLLGFPIVVWRDNQAVWIPPEEIPIDDDPPQSVPPVADAPGSPA